MPPLFVLAGLIGLPLVLSVFLRVKPLYLFVSIVTGYFWVEFLGETAEIAFSSLLKVSNPEVVINVGLLLIPVVLTLFIMRKTLSTAALPFQFFLLAADSLLLATFLLPLLTSGVQGSVYGTEVGDTMRSAYDVVIAGVAGLHLLVMLVMRPKVHGKGKHRKH